MIRPFILGAVLTAITVFGTASHAQQRGQGKCTVPLIGKN